MDRMEIYDLESRGWGDYQLATAADKRNAIPEPRTSPCSVIARAKDGSSYNIYMFGGSKGTNSSDGYNDMWVLSIPSFKWFLVNTGRSATGTPPNSKAMTCYIVGGGRKMLVYGGNLGDGTCDRTDIHVFDMTNLTWEEDYDPSGGEYEVPKDIYEVIGGGPDGGATLLPEISMANSGMEAKFKDIIRKTSGMVSINNTSTNTSLSDPSDPDVESDSTVKESSKSGGSGGVIAGIVVGVFVGISLIVLGILLFLKQSKATAGGTGLPGSNGIPPAEMPTMLAPRELHPYSLAPYAQELHAYMPNEMASSIQARDSCYEPDKPVLDVRRAEVGGGESI